ncbi:hypothetical protein Smp_016890 [Schistosoma mansoni]|uniref:hypothetical protein n=1 Tax=Schistosoma mansoni TaxID=6183 RepID=UPI0001A63422|nr:hypothetical protein Smp_016890 [Schistosoma mansoni]|eukprot:XP_018653392.1 hypothetical protein Smp_016890 [Schistosoma mansoni]
MNKTLILGLRHYVTLNAVFPNFYAHRTKLSPICRNDSKFHSVRCNQIQYSPFSKVSHPPNFFKSPISLTTYAKFSTQSENNSPSNVNENNENDLEKRKSSLIKRFKDAYAIYGKVVLVIHGVTSCLWFGLFYSLACTGINLLDILQSLNAPEWLSKPLHLGGGTVNTLATAIVFYKLMVPFRYGLTLILTRYLVRYLRLKGKAPQVQENDRLRNLAKEGAEISRERLKARMARSRRNVLMKRNQR